MKWQDRTDMTVVDEHGYSYTVTQVKCPVCKSYSSKVWQYGYEPYTYCPYCGARMKGRGK